LIFANKCFSEWVSTMIGVGVPLSQFNEVNGRKGSRRCRLGLMFDQHSQTPGRSERKGKGTTARSSSSRFNAGTMGRKPEITGVRARDPGAFKSVLVRINIEGWKALKILEAEHEATLNALAVEAFNDLSEEAWEKTTSREPPTRLSEIGPPRKKFPDSTVLF